MVTRNADTGQCNLPEQILSRILMKCYNFMWVDSIEVFEDTVHVKARADNKKMQKR